MTKYSKSSLESIFTAWGKLLRDFRVWSKPEGQAMYHWKTAPVSQAILACRGSMIDDAEAMLGAWIENQNRDGEKGQSAFIPVMTTAIATIQAPPSDDQVIGRSEWLDVILPQDPLKKPAQMRLMPSAFRCQVAYFSPDEHGAMMLANQFCLYLKNESKRTFDVQFEHGFINDEKIITTDQFRVLENSLYPDKADFGYKNMTIVTIDATMIGNIPIIVADHIQNSWNEITDTVEQGTPPKLEPVKGSRTPDVIESKKYVVTEADVYDNKKKQGEYIHIEADLATGERTVEKRDASDKN